MGGRILAVYHIIEHEGELYGPPSGVCLVLVECVVVQCVGLVLVYSITLMSSCVLDIGGTPTMVCTCHYRMDGAH